MFKLSKLNDNLYCIYSSKFSIEGTKSKIILEMFERGVDSLEEIELGMNEVEVSDYAEYGLSLLDGSVNFIYGGNFIRNSA